MAGIGKHPGFIKRFFSPGDMADYEVLQFFV